MAITTDSDVPGFVLDTTLGIYVPQATYGPGKWMPHPFDAMNKGFVRAQGIVRHKEGLGTELAHDEETGVAFWPAYASGLDDMLMRALVQGYMYNSGQTPVLNTLLSTIVTKVQSMVGTWLSTVRGRTSPVKKTLDLMARAQDSQFGAAEFVKLYMGSILTDNRGAIGAQVPIGEIPFDNWDQYGMEVEKIPGQSDAGNKMYVLRMEQEAFRENQGLWMLDGLHCFPTGNSEYPYWISKWSQDMTESVWVLVHRDFGFQVFSPATGRNDLYPGFGQSATWRFSPYMVKFMAIDRQDWEHLINQPMRGIVWISGLDYPTQFRDQLEIYHEERDEQEMYFYPGVFFGGSRGENSKISMFPWSEPPAGFTPEGWRNEWTDALAAAFHLNVTHLVVRLGEGAMTQSDVASSIEAETAVAAMKQQIEMVWNYLAPPRVIVSVVWQTDRTRRFQIESFEEMALAISRLNQMSQAPNAMIPNAPPILSREEIRALIEGFVGIEIPETEEYDTIEPDTKTGDDVEETYWPHYDGLSIPEVHQKYNISFEAMLKKGQKVMFLHSGELATVLHWSGNNEWVWVQHENRYAMLVPGHQLCLVGLSIIPEIQNAGARDQYGKTHYSYEANEDGITWHGTFEMGSRAKTLEGTPCTVIGFAGPMALVRYDWDQPHTAPREIHANDLRPFEVEVEGDPLPRVDVVELDPDEATEEARNTWTDIAPDDLDDLLDAEEGEPEE